MIAVAALSNMRSIILVALLLFIIPNAVFGVRLGAGSLLFTADIFLLVGAGMIAIYGFMTDHSRRRLFGVKAELLRIARTDGLTNVFNRRFFIEMAGREVARSKRYNHPICCMMLDIDHFKNINDTFGHQAGDEVLKEMAKASVSAIREIDIFGRLGGEEFAIALPETDIDDAMNLAERIRQMLDQLEMGADDKHIAITVSIGVAVLTSTDDTIESILKRADEALYRAKSSGRNKVLAAT